MNGHDPPDERGAALDAPRGDLARSGSEEPREEVAHSGADSQATPVLNAVDVLAEGAPKPDDPIELGQWITLTIRTLWQLVRHDLKPGELAAGLVVTLLSYGCGRPFLELPSRGRKLLGPLCSIEYRNLAAHFTSLQSRRILRIEEMMDGSTRYQIVPDATKWTAKEREHQQVVNGSRLALEFMRGQRIMEAILPDAVKPLEEMLTALELRSALAGNEVKSEIKTNRAGGTSEFQTNRAAGGAGQSGWFTDLRAAAEGEAEFQTKPAAPAIAIAGQRSLKRQSCYSRSWSEVKEAALQLNFGPAGWTDGHRAELKGLVQELFGGDFGLNNQWRRYWNKAVRVVPHIVTEVVVLLAGEKHRGDEHAATHSVAYKMMVDRGYATIPDAE
ncbi:MAG TPA: hypothetical protein VFT34_17475 [Verrucomicrobiae bacterium]|nr:hypothetical protein [Verrucomicrobiae bacterium]